MNSILHIDTDYWISTQSEQASQSKRPSFIIAERFHVHILKVKENYSGNKVKSYLIAGKLPSEKLIIYYIIHDNGRVIKRKVLLGMGLDPELGRLGTTRKPAKCGLSACWGGVWGVILSGFLERLIAVNNFVEWIRLLQCFNKFEAIQEYFSPRPES